jgi:hypothetical protein
MENRHVGFLTIFKLLQNKRQLFFLGSMFTFMSIVSFVIFFSVISNISEPYDAYDHEIIIAEGHEQEAAVVSVVSESNTRVNGKNPIVITYTYKDNGTDKTDKFRTLDVEKAEVLTVGDKLKIKAYKNQSSVLGYEPFTFPVMFFIVIGPIIFFIAGIVMLLITVIPVFKIVNLYKKGIVQEAEVYAIVPVSGMPVTNIGRKVSIDYTYTQNGEKQYGNTTSTDFYLLAEIKAGDKVKIFVSEDGKKSCLIPKREAIKNNWNINFS